MSRSLNFDCEKFLNGRLACLRCITIQVDLKGLQYLDTVCWCGISLTLKNISLWHFQKVLLE